MLTGCWTVESGQERSSAIVYGLDDRRESFEVPDTHAAATLARSLVAFIPASSLTDAGDISAPSYGSTAELCPGEPFAEQPAAAFCSGVLLDWDLVLTAGHCVRLFALDDFRIVFGYFYEKPGELRLNAGDIVRAVQIVAEELDPSGVQPRLDYAWVRLQRPVAPPRRPAAVHATPPRLGVGMPIVSIGTTGGTPAKIDDGGRVHAPREEWMDYFAADSDTSAGGSGGAAFDENMVLLGVLARGRDDFTRDPDLDCNVTIRASSEVAEEQFTYAHRAVQGLCAKHPGASSLCRADCQGACEALPGAVATAAGCALVPSRPRDASRPSAIAVLLVGALLSVRARSERSSASNRSRS